MQNGNVTIVEIQSVSGSKYSPAAAYFTPFMIVIGLCTNFLVVIVMLRGTVKTTPTARIYYCWVAIFDLLTISFKDVIFTFLNMGLRYIYSESPPWFVFASTYASDTCKAGFAIYSFAELNSTYAILALAIERMLVLYFPFRTAQLTGRTKVLCGLSGQLLLFALLSATIPFSSKLVVNPSFSPLPICTTSTPMPLMQYSAIAIYMLIYVGAFSLATIVTVFVVVRMQAISVASKRLGRSGSAEGKQLAELRTTVVMVLSVVLHDVIFFPIGATYCAQTITLSINASNTVLLATLTTLWVQFYPFAILSHSTQFFIYYFKVPGFKESVHDLITYKGC